jgi:hypothetical protein
MEKMRHRGPVRAIVFLIALALPSFAAADSDWADAYRRGLQASAAENYPEAIEEFQRAIAGRPMEFIDEQHPINGIPIYLPHSFLGAAKIRFGDAEGALAEFKISEQQGVVAQHANYAEQQSRWKVWAIARIKAASALRSATEAQKRAIAAGADHTETYRKAVRALEQATYAYETKTGDEGSYVELYQHAFGYASEGSNLFNAAIAETKTTARPMNLRPTNPQTNPQPTTTQPQPTVTPTPVMPAPVPAPVPQPAAPLTLQPANIAFDTPQQINLGAHRVMKLLLDPRRPAAVLEQQLHGQGPTATASIKISEVVEAHLTGAAFDIRAISPDVQEVSGDGTTEWQWEVTPKQEGQQRLFLTVNELLGSGADQRRRSIRTFDKTIDVRMPPRPGPAPLIIAVAVLAVLAVLVVAGLLFLALKRRDRAPRTLDATVPIVAPTVRESTVVTSGAMHFRNGQVIEGRYRIVGRLGQGGMGTVYAAEDLEFEGELVALKTILAAGDDVDGVLTRFKKEIQLARRVAHPNVCRIFDVGYHATGAAQKAIFVSMEYVTGETLKTFIEHKGRLTEQEALPIIRDVAAALDATHAAGLIHRDVKSGNVMLANHGARAVLMDFGVACLSTPIAGEPSLTKTGAIVGTPSYMAPEQIEGTTLTAATDIYAFGIVIYEMITGRLPYEGDTPMSILAKRLRESPPSPAQFVPNLRPDWERTILTCLEYDPAKRFRHAMDVSRALNRAADATTMVM